jgi:hypothetical protein
MNAKVLHHPLIRQISCMFYLFILDESIFVKDVYRNEMKYHFLILDNEK